MPKKVDPRVEHISYGCTACGKPTPRAKLTVKRAQFAPMGEGAKVIKTRTTAWLCPACLASDEDFNRPVHKGAPGMANTKLAREP